MSKVCATLHRRLQTLPIHSFPFDASSVPANGIYALYERGETAHGSNRIVRVGTHTGIAQLRSRLSQHFVLENKDRSIFRKHIGRAILRRDDDPFLAHWDIDLTTREARLKHGSSIDQVKKLAVERLVTSYIRDRFRFVVFQVDSKQQRLWLEARMIATLASCDECIPSNDWLGRHSPNAKIRASGLWLVNHLGGTALSERDLDDLEIQAGTASPAVRVGFPVASSPASDP